MEPWSSLADRLSRALRLASSPIAITFLDAMPTAPFDLAMPAPTADGLTGRVPAGCVFWNHAEHRSFATVAADHGNCSLGCALSRARTGMAATEFACALPGEQLADVVDSIERAAELDAAVARYAGADTARFATAAS